MRDEDRVMLNCKTDSSHINNITRYKRAILAFFINSIGMSSLYRRHLTN